MNGMHILALTLNMKSLVIRLIKYLFPVLLFLTVFLLNIEQINAQEDTCLNKLKRAQELFDNGLVEEIPILIEPCLNSKDGFNKEQSIQAFRLLIQVYLFDYNQDKAEKAMLELLSRYPEYELQINDPVEFANLYKQFKTKPLYSFGINAGLNVSNVSVLEHFSTNSLNDLDSKYKIGDFNSTFGVSFEKYFNSKAWITLAAGYSSGGYQVDEKFNSNRELLTFKEKMQYAQVPVYFNYAFTNNKKFVPYVMLGGQFAYLLKSNAEINRSMIDKDIESSGLPMESKNMTDSRNRINYSALTGVGARFKVAAGYIRANLFYTMGFTEHVKNSSRFDDKENLFYYNFIDDRIKINYLTLSVGYSYLFYKTVKKVEQ
jgi:hypothetical protein